MLEFVPGSSFSLRWSLGLSLAVFVTMVEIRSCDAARIALFPQGCSAFQNLLFSHVNFWIVSSSSMKNVVGILMISH